MKSEARGATFRGAAGSAKVGLITTRIPPERCGIGDQTVRFAQEIGRRGYQHAIFARAGSDVNGVIVPSLMTGRDIAKTVATLSSLALSEVILQYTPLMYTNTLVFQPHRMLQEWKAIADRWPTSIIVHETYYRSATAPLSVLRGTMQKYWLKRMAQTAGHVFTASQPLVDEFQGWALSGKVSHLPIGPNIRVYRPASAVLRGHYGIAPETTVALIFGGGANIAWMRNHISAVERSLRSEHVPLKWLLLGGVTREQLPLTSESIEPCWLSEQQLSEHLQMADLLLVPHRDGLSSKRSTVMAAMQHGLAIVGTRGRMTDKLWAGAPGVVLVDESDIGGFTAAVAEITQSRSQRTALGGSNETFYRANLSWDVIIGRYLNSRMPPHRNAVTA